MRPQTGAEGIPLPDPCTLHIRVRQTFTGRVPIVHATYTVADLSRMWKRPESSIRVWLSVLRHYPQYKPEPPYVRLHRINSVRRHLEIRSDYAELIRNIFIDRLLPLK